MILIMDQLRGLNIRRRSACCCVVYRHTFGVTKLKSIRRRVDSGENQPLNHSQWPKRASNPRRQQRGRRLGEKHSLGKHVPWQNLLFVVSSEFDGRSHRWRKTRISRETTTVARRPAGSLPGAVFDLGVFALAGNR